MTKVRAIQNVRHSEKRGGKLDRKVTQSNTRGGFATKKCDATDSKKHEILRVTFFLNNPYDDVLFCCIFYECT